MPTKQEYTQRFLDKTIPEPNSGCLLWTGGSYGGDGYGSFRYESRPTAAHRVAWLLERGTIPDGVKVLHQCDVPPCVNVDHLFLGTDQDNCRDKFKKGRDWQSRRTHCPHGHPVTPENTYHHGGRSICATCHKAKTARQIAAKRRVA